MALRRMHSRGKGSLEKGLPVVEFSAVARYQNLRLFTTVNPQADQLQIVFFSSIPIDLRKV